jgi:hypothetical protein
LQEEMLELSQLHSQATLQLARAKQEGDQAQIAQATADLQAAQGGLQTLRPLYNQLLAGMYSQPQPKYGIQLRYGVRPQFQAEHGVRARPSVPVKLR